MRPADRVHAGRARSALTLETLDGTEDLVVPAGTQTGRVFKLRGRGVPAPRRSLARRSARARAASRRRRACRVKRKSCCVSSPRSAARTSHPPRRGSSRRSALRSSDRLTGGPAQASPVRTSSSTTSSTSCSRMPTDTTSRVLRVRPGDPLTVSDGAGRWRRPVRPTARTRGRDHVRRPRRAGDHRRLRSGEGRAARVGRAEADRVGVDTIVPLVAERSVVVWPAGSHRPQLDRLRRISREAAMQSSAVLPARGRGASRLRRGRGARRRLPRHTGGDAPSLARPDRARRTRGRLVGPRARRPASLASGWARPCSGPRPRRWPPVCSWPRSDPAWCTVTLGEITGPIDCAPWPPSVW